MKKIYVGLVVALMTVSLSGNVQAEMPQIGVGYEGMFLGEFLQGLSARAWFDQLGVEGNLQQASVDVYGDDFDVYLLSGKVFYAPIVKENSQFYIGLEGGFGQIDYSASDMDITLFGPFFGAEYRFAELPEMGFCWEVGYRFTDFEMDDDDAELDGISISLGLHYYFN